MLKMSTISRKARWVVLFNLAQIRTYNRRVKFGLKIPNRLGKCPKTSGFLMTHTAYINEYIKFLLLIIYLYSSLITNMVETFILYFTVKITGTLPPPRKKIGKNIFRAIIM